MNTESKSIIAWVFFIVGLFAFSIIFNTIGLVLGTQIREGGGSSAPMIANGIALVLYVFTLV